MNTRKLTKASYMVSGVVLLVVAVEVIARLGIAGTAWPSLVEVYEFLGDERQRSTLWRNTLVTLESSATGLVMGTIIAVLAGAVSALVPILRPGLDRFAAIVNAVPLVALAPLFITTVGREDSPAVVAAMGVGFVVFVSTTSGLANASRTHHDVLTVLGANRFRRFARLQLPQALPSIVDGLVLAAPTAVLGATIGEWFGAPSGLGMMIVSAFQSANIPQLWAVALSATAMALIAYFIFIAVQRATVRRFT
ncbi:ABC transporter permease [Nesterenkonia muleiensis]|uniref:ABC transporter permease n=1 Tax=Nesterenkonia muleiensis TaxID=2282648 RepID=UPI00192E39EA|nr:ABC transporter permease subunit [Nesterenkonia muleiensis]